MKGIATGLVNNLSYTEVTDGDHRHAMIHRFGLDLCKAIFQTKIAKDLRDSKKKYDLIVTEIFSSDCMLGYVHVFQVPVVALSTSVNLPWASNLFGLPDNPSYIPNYFVPYTSEMSLLQRITNTLSLIKSNFV